MKKTLTLCLLIIVFSVPQYGSCTENNEVQHYDQVTNFTVPPWKMYPELEYKSMGWRMGYGEYYILRWHKYFRALESNKMQEYKAANPESESWEGFYSASEQRYIKLESMLKNDK